MPRPRREVDEVLRSLYEQIPPMADCKGLCWASCGPVDMSDRERQRIREAGIRITPARDIPRFSAEYWCEALGPDGRCQVYPLRPLMCRLWGAVEGMKCPYGCVPEGGYLDDETGRRLIAEALRAGGGDLDEMRAAALEHAMTVPWMRAILEQEQLRGAAGDCARAARHDGVLPQAVTGRKARKVRLPPGTRGDP